MDVRAFIAGGWFERSGEWAPLRNLMDILALSARTVVDDSLIDAALGFLIDAVSRWKVVAEPRDRWLAAERLRRVDGNLIQIHAAMIEQDIDRRRR